MAATQVRSTHCAHARHDQCELSGCECNCHTQPERFEKSSEAARKANATRAAEARGETAPKRPTVGSGKKPAIPVAAAKQIKSEFAFLLWLGDGMVAGVEQIPQWTPEDRLAPAEIEGLTSAVYNELEARAPWLLKYLARAQESAPEAALIYTLAMIALPRLARREAVLLGVKITPEFARAVVLAPIVAQQAAATAAAGTANPGAASVGAESTPVRSNGVTAAGPKHNAATEQVSNNHVNGSVDPSVFGATQTGQV